MSGTDSDVCSLLSQSEWESWSVCDSDSQSEAGSVLLSDYESVASDQGSESWEEESVASDVSVEEDLDMDESQAGDECLFMLCEMYMCSELSVLKLCVLCFWAAKAGVKGGASAHALPLGSLFIVTSANLIAWWVSPNSTRS